MIFTSFQILDFRLKCDERWESVLMLLQNKRKSCFSITFPLIETTDRSTTLTVQTNGTPLKPTHRSYSGKSRQTKAKMTAQDVAKDSRKRAKGAGIERPVLRQP